jgi:hypothetical protein
MESAETAKTKPELAGPVLARMADQHPDDDLEPLTVAAINRDPWNAIFLDLPENGTAKLYRIVADTAQWLRETPEAELSPMPFPAPADDLEWSALGDEINIRWKDAIGKVIEADRHAELEAVSDITKSPPRTRLAETRDEMEERHRDEWELVHGAYGVEALPSQLERRHAEERARFEAWQQPAFSYDTIKSDPWTAVYLAIPENASPVLLNVAYNAAARCIEALDHGGLDLSYTDAITHAPLQGYYTENRVRAETRRDELQAMLYPIGAPAADLERRERIGALEDMAVTAAREMLQPTPLPHRPERDWARYRPKEPSMPDKYYVRTE